MISHKLFLNFLSLFIDLSLQICYPVLLLAISRGKVRLE